MFLSIVLLFLESPDARAALEAHRNYGQQFLNLHHQAERAFADLAIKATEVKRLQQEYDRLKLEKRPDIPQLAYWWARRAISTGELRSWWK